MTVSTDFYPSISFASLPSPPTLPALKSLKNVVVGNPRAKAKAISDSELLNLLVSLCRPSENEKEDNRLLRIEATIILGSLAHADQQLTALLNLLSTPLITNLLLALQQAAFSASPSSSGPQKELEIILKTLANVVKLIGEFCDRGKWGTGVDGPVRGARGRETWSREMDARETVGRKIGELLELPLLTLLLNLIPSPPPPPTSTPTSSSHPRSASASSNPSALLPTVLNLLASLIHTPAHRQAFLSTTSSTTIPFSHPIIPHLHHSLSISHFPSSISKGKQRETPLSFPSSGGGGNDVLVKIVALLRNGAGDAKVKIGALGLLGVLAKEEWVGRELRGMVELDGTSLFTHLGDLARNRAVGVQLAAVEVLATIYKSTRSRSSTSDDRIEDWLGMMEDLSRLLGERGEERIRASFIMAYLIADDLPLQTVASEGDVVRRLEEILEESSGDGTSRGTEEDLEMDLGEEDLDGKARMREGALLLLSTLTLHLPHLRTQLLTIIPHLLPSILLASLSHPTSSGVRAAAAQLARGLSRSVSVLRSSLVDAEGVVERLVEMVKDEEESEEVKSGVVAVLANLVLEFAPMKLVSWVWL
ncbi:armadillo-type protein [Mrakia frigida]|uniref:armadillo-type protein n=1 Tax=Mrakia frigida TaxID=29902 RepID=UPI003FCBFC4E